MLIEGSHGEGGGQILRTAISLAAVMKKEIEIINIRKGRKVPGIKNQHLHGIKLVAEMTDAEVENLKIGATRIKFHPQDIKGGKYKVNIGTAGSITLILQSSMIPALFADSHVIFDITGGTDVSWSPPVDYYRYVLLPLLRKMGARVSMNIIERGYYPQGGGRVIVKIEPSKLKGITIGERGELIYRRAYINLRNLPEHILMRMKSMLQDYEIHEDVKNSGISRGCGILLVHEYENTIIGADNLCRIGVPAERIVKECVKKLQEEIRHNATVDIHMADNIMPFGFLAEGGMKYYVSRITEHTKTNAWVIKKFGGEVEIEENKIEIK